MSATLRPRELACNACPTPANCSPTFCRFNDAELPVVMFEPPEPTPSATLAARANERIRRLEMGRAHLLTIADTPGNWWDKLPWYGRLSTVCGVVLAVGLVVGLS